MSVHWPSFWLGLFAPSYFILLFLAFAALISDVVNWLAPSDRRRL